MLSHRSISRFSVRVGLLNQPSRLLGFRSETLPFDFNSFSQNYSAFPGSRNSKDHANMLANAAPNFLGSLGMKLGFLKVNDNSSLPSALNFRSKIHSAGPKEFELGRDSRPMNFARGVMNEDRSNGESRPMNFVRGGVMNEDRSNGESRPMNFVRGGMNENRSNGFRGPQFSHEEVEREAADVVHIKLIRNNAFVTVTDSKGNKKIGASSGRLSSKASRYSADSTAELVGKRAREMGLKSFVVKVNGFTFFKKKKQAILSFRDGFTNSRNDQNPIVYIEDTTRRAHNGCRLRKQRRI